MLLDTLANAMLNLKNSELVGKKDCTIKPATKLSQNVLEVLKDKGYIGEYKMEAGRKGGKIVVNLIGRINNCGVIKPRFPVKASEIREWEQKYLPAQGFGMLILSTPKGVMNHEDAKKEKTGGVLLAYAY